MVSNSVSWSFAGKVASSSVTVAEWVILREMYGAGADTSPGAVAELTGLSRGAVSKLIDRLLKKGLVTRSTASSDRRYQEIKLTAKGASLVPKLAALADENDREFFGVLTPAERKQLMLLLKKTARIHRLTKAPIE